MPNSDDLLVNAIILKAKYRFTFCRDVVLHTVES